MSVRPFRMSASTKFPAEKGRENPGEARECELPAVFSELPVEAGTTIRVETPSGAGFGDALQRDPERVLADVRSGKVTVEIARRDYGVVLTRGRVDPKKTLALRKQLTKDR